MLKYPMECILQVFGRLHESVTEVEMNWLKRKAALILAAVMIFGILPAGRAYAAADGFAAGVSMFYCGSGWQIGYGDNVPASRAGTYPTAVRFYLTGQPAGMTGTVIYSVYSSGTGWMGPIENNCDCGITDGAAGIESIKAWFNGALQDYYDIYYKVCQNGTWTAWMRNGAEAGIPGSGAAVTGIRLSVRAKGTGEPEEAFTPAGVDPSRPMVALTFDDGPSSVNTPRVLAALEAAGGRATFFMVGNRVAANASVVQRMVSDGCELGNHTWNHETLSKISQSEIISVVSRTNQTIQDACGAAPTVMRPPGGAINQNAQDALASIGLPAVLWNIDTLDWKTRNTQSTVDAVLSQVKDGDIILMHDIHEPTAAAVEILVPELTARGFQLVTVSQLASARGGMVPGGKYFRFRPVS